jgi:hypothetical protein
LPAFITAPVRTVAPSEADAPPHVAEAAPTPADSAEDPAFAVRPRRRRAAKRTEMIAAQ